MQPDTPVSHSNVDQIDTGTPQRLSLLSHDLRSALSDIVGGLSLIDPATLDRSAKLQFDRVSAAGETLARLLETLAETEAQQSDKMLPGKGNVDLPQFLEDTRRRWSGSANEKGIEFHLDTAAALPAIATTDRIALERIIGNLIGNAVKFTDTGSVAVRVDVSGDDDLTFTIVDDGPGFSVGALDLLYEYLGRPDNAQKPGTGLGLFIAKELSDRLGGALTVENRDGGGAKVRLSLPHSAWFNRSLRPPEEREIPAGRKSPDLSHLKILLAEDNTTNQLVVTQMLRVMGASYVVASDGIEALDCLHQEHFDLALLDIEMPRMSGLELIKTVRGMEGPVSNMPLVALTAYVMREHRDRIYAAGADGIIAKPLMSIQDLGVSILGFFDGADLRTNCMNGGEANNGIEADAVDVVDREIFDTLIQAIGEESSDELLEKLQADADSVAEGIAHGQKILDLPEIRAQTHILISVAGAIGATGLQKMAQKLNTAANRVEDASGVELMCEECLKGLAALQAFVVEEQSARSRQTSQSRA